jgi:hypothetical protein
MIRDIRIRLGLPNARFEFPFTPGVGNYLKPTVVLPSHYMIVRWAVKKVHNRRENTARKN